MSEENLRFDPLVGCLQILCHLENIPFSEKAAVAGLPIPETGLTPSLFVRAAKRTGFTAHVAKRSISKISHLVLPAVLMLKNNNACVLTKIDDSKQIAEVYFPENPEEIRDVPWDELERDYAGYTIHVTPIHHFESRSQQLIKAPGASWFWGVIFRYKSIFFHVFIAAFLTNMFVLVAPVYIMNVYDRVLPTHATETLWMLTIGALIFFSFDFVARLLRGFLIDESGRRADIILAGELFQQMLGLKMRQKPTSAGAFANYFNEFEVLREFFTSATIVSFIDLPFVVLFLLVIYYIGGSIVIVPLLAVPIVIGVSFLLELPTQQAVKKALAGATEKSAILVEAITGLETIKTIGAEGMMQHKWEESVASQTKATLRSRILSNVTLNFSVYMSQLVLVGVIFYGAHLVAANQLTLGALVACTILSGRVTMLGQVVNLSSRFARSRASLKALNKIMNLPHEYSADQHYLHRPLLKGHIQFENVSFLYPKRRIPAIDGVSFDIKPGEKVGIIGKIGSGKTTLLKLLISLYVPGNGSILVDGTDNGEIDPADLRHNIRYVSNDSTLFYGTVKENIAMGNPFATDEEIIAAADLAGVHSFVSESPLGYDMPVGERGESVSSGQRQAIILARALVADPPVLLLDDPTSDVDNTYEQTLLQKLPTYFADKTILLVTHRMSMLKLVDRLIVLEGGKLVADGPRDVVLETMKEAVKQKLEAMKQANNEKDEAREEDT